MSIIIKAMNLLKLFGLTTFSVFQHSMSFNCQKSFENIPCFWLFKILEKVENNRKGWKYSKRLKKLENVENTQKSQKSTVIFETFETFLNIPVYKWPKFDLNFHFTYKNSWFLIVESQYLVSVSTVKKDQNFWLFLQRG